MSKSPYQAYGVSSKLGLSGRALEAQAFTMSAQKLQEAHDNADNRALVMKALRYNNRLWTVVQTELTDPNSTVPEDVKAGMLSLSLFVDERTREAIASPDAGLLDALIEINRNMALAQLSNKK
ncbi:MAG: flagellar protein FlaF [Rhodospirillales bacterium]|jgi:flagellar biosynthesis activator protein FlaF|nr:flagellar protein FlaF [Rhodospirillales bacterium]